MKTKVSSGVRYRSASGPEGAFQPGSHGRVLRNLSGLTRKRDMDLAEFVALVAVQRGYAGDYRLLEDFFVRALARARSI